MHKMVYFLAVMALLWLNGCSAGATPLALTPTPENSAAISASDTPTAVFTPTSLPATQTPVPTASATLVLPSPTAAIPPEARLQVHQLHVFDTFLKGDQAEGYAVLKQTVLKPGASEENIVIINLATQERWQVDLPTKSSWVRSVLGYFSPDEKWLIHLKNFDIKEPEDEVYEVLSAEGKAVQTFTLPWEWKLRDSWLNDRQILADKRYDPNGYVFQTMAIDPVTGQKRILPFDYPDIWNSFDPYQYDINVYNPSLTFVIYPGLTADSVPGLILRNTLNHKNIFAKFAMLFNNEPTWSPDGKMFAISSNTTIYGGWTDGTVKNLTHFDQWQDVWFGPAEKLFWSPDSLKIAFSMSPSLLPGERSYEKKDNCLALMDVAAESVTNYCMSGYNMPGGFYVPKVWAQNSRMILVEADPTKGSFQHIFLIDLEKENAFDLGEYTEPLYFLDTLPAVWAKK